MTFRLLGFPITIQNGAWILAGIAFLFGMRGPEGPRSALLWIAVGAFSLVVHELGHAGVARFMGLTPIAITLHGMGGTTTHRAPNRPYKSLLIALAGPAAGLALVPIGIIGLLLTQTGGIANEIATVLVWLNLVWSVFNLLPIFPMDGGVALWGALATVTPRLAAPITALLGFFGALSLSIYFLVQGSYWTVFILGSMVVDNFQLLRRIFSR